MKPRITDRARLAQALLATPYRRGGSDWAAVDCFGLVELWLWNLHGVAVSDRLDMPPGPDGLEDGFGRFDTSQWVEVTGACRDDDVLFFRQSVPVLNAKGELTGRRIIEHGHCGVMTGGKFLHAFELRAPSTNEAGEEDPGGGIVRVEEMTRAWERRISAVLRRVELNQ